MPKGSFEWFNARRGFGFIVPDDGGAEPAGSRILSTGQRLE
jgi:cold shock CspA family protein